ncbi:hypothetical protein UT300012_14920 [Paraclostridium bifermentans]|nr:hypothetical protein [Paraclostridium bifermentans]
MGYKNKKNILNLFNELERKSEEDLAKIIDKMKELIRQERE